MMKIELPPSPTEDQIQSSVMEWARLNEQKFPELKDLYHIPNGSHKSPSQRARFTRLGLKSGVPDLHLPWPCGMKYHSLYIEVKRKGQKPSERQREWHQRLTLAGNKVVCLDNFDDIIECLTDYLKQRKIPNIPRI